MAERVRAHDWASTPLGPVETWPELLKATVANLLASGFPAALVWGPGLVTIYNDAFRPILGQKPEALGRSFADIWAEAWDEIGPIAERAFKGEATYIEDFPLVIARSGQPEPACFTFSYSPVRAADGTVVGLIDTVIETTARVRAERVVRENEARFRAFVTASADMVYRMSPDWSQLHELEGQGILADTVETSGRWMEDYIHPDDRGRVQATIDRAIRTRSMFELELRVRRADGSIGWMLSRAVPILDDQGEIVEWLGAASDVTFRRQTEEALRESQARLDAAFEVLPVGVAYVDGTGTTLLANREMHRYLPTGIVPWRDDSRYWRWRAWHPDGSPVGRQDYPTPRALRGESVLPGLEMLYMPDDGREVWTRVASVPVRDGDGRIVAAASVVTDIDALKRAQETQATLIAELQHRTRNLLAIVSATARQTLRTCDSLAEFAGRFHERLSALSRVQRLLSRGEGHCVALRELVDSEVQAHGASSEDSRVHVDGPEILLPSREVQVLMLALHELATNAVKHGALALDQAGLSVTWWVSDEGNNRFLDLRWVETGVRLPPQDGPARRGFGRQLIERSLPHQLDGTAVWRLEPDGVCCELRLPLREELAR